MKKIHLILLVVLVSLIVSSGTTYVYDHYFRKDRLKIAAIDLKGFLAEQRKLYISGEIDDETFRANVDRLEKVIASIPDGTVVLMADSVIKGVKVIDVDKKTGEHKAVAQKSQKED